MAFERILIPLAMIRLKKDNDRHGQLHSEQECIQWMLTHQGQNILNLAKDISENSLSPLDGILVLPESSKESTEYIVWEGNRRITALKILDDPNRCHDPAMHSKFLKIKKNSKFVIPKEIECIVAPSEEEAERLIELRHQGPQDGIGTVPWDPIQKNRHLERLGKKGKYSLSQIIIESFLEKMDDPLKKIVNDRKFPISTLERLLSNPEVRKFLGIAVENGSPTLLLEKDEIYKGLKKILNDIAEGMTARQINSTKQQEEYLNSFSDKNVPDKNKRNKIESIPSPPISTPTSLSPTQTQPRLRPLSHERKYLIPSRAKYSIKNERLNSIYRELRTLHLNSYPNAIGILFRVFIEIGVELYLEKQGISFNKDEKLKNKLSKSVNHMKTEKWLDENSSKGADIAISTPHHTCSINSFNAYVHNEKFNPSPKDLCISWDNLQPFFDCLFNHL